MQELTIRAATIQDCEGIQYVHMGTPGPWANIGECIPWISKRLERGYYVQVAELNGQVAGHAEWIETHDHSGKYLYLCVMQIKTEYQGRGIGRKMVEDGINKARALGCTKVVTIPDEDTGSGIFYAKCGFTKGRQIMSISIPTHDYGYSQAYTTIDRVPFEVIRERRFIFGLSQVSARHMWEVNNEMPAGDNRVTANLVSDTGDYIQICGLYYNPKKAWVLCWSNAPRPVLVRDALNLGKSQGYEELLFDFFAEHESFFNGYDKRPEAYCVETYRPV